jgi:RNA polymerase sigma factor (sigma-70 family)
MIATSDPPACVTSHAADLLMGIRERDPAAWHAIMQRYGSLVFATVRSFRLQDADARDAVQTTWLALAENAHQIRYPERLGGWLVTTARRACLHILRHAKPVLAHYGALAETVADPSVGPEQHVIDADVTRILWRFVSELPPRKQALLRALFANQTRHYTEVAHIAGMRPGGIGPTRARTLAQLRHRLEQHGLKQGA